MVSDQLTVSKRYARTRTTSDRLTTPLERLIGNTDLWGRIDSFINLSKASDRSSSTISSYRNMLSNLVCYLNSIGITRPEQVTEEHAVAYILERKETCNSTSVNTYFRHASAWFNWMVDREILTKSPFAKLKVPTLPKTVIRPLDYEQVQKMLACCSHYFCGRRDRAIVSLIFDSGIRRSELSNIKLEDIDLKRGAIKIMGKGAKERYVAIGETAADALKDYLLMRTDSLPWLVVSIHKDCKMSAGAITIAIQKLMKRAGIIGVKLGPHTLRHSFATAAIRNGANLFYVQSLLGHSTLAMTRRYAATVDSEEAVRNHRSFSPLDKIKK